MKMQKLCVYPENENLLLYNILFCYVLCSDRLVPQVVCAATDRRNNDPNVWTSTVRYDVKAMYLVLCIIIVALL